jgi:hypothetical protein
MGTGIKQKQSIFFHEMASLDNKLVMSCFYLTQQAQILWRSYQSPEITNYPLIKKQKRAKIYRPNCKKIG